jgi:hypothetical protein
LLPSLSWLQVHLFSRQMPEHQQHLLPLVEREVAGLMSARIYPDKQIEPFPDNQPMLITTLLLNAAACHLRDPYVCRRPCLAARNALHLAAAAIALQPRYGKAYFRAACALAKLKSEKSIRSAHAIMRYAAQLEGRPAAELLAHLPPLPPGALDLPLCGGEEVNAVEQLMYVIYYWPYLMRRHAPAGQDFLLQLPGGLGELPPLLLHAGFALFDAEANVAEAMVRKERGNAAFVVGDTAGALREYNTGINHLRALTALHLQYNSKDMAQAVDDRCDPSDDPDRDLILMRYLLATAAVMDMLPYQGQTCVEVLVDAATPLYPHDQVLPPVDRLPGCNDMPSLIGRFWTQLKAKFMEPYGGVEGLLANPQAWTHHYPGMHPVNINWGNFFY